MTTPDLRASAPLDAVARWPVEQAAAAVVDRSGVVADTGDASWQTRIASITKPLFGYAVLVAVEEGSLTLDRPAGPEGSTVRHLLAHASGLPFRGQEPITAPGQRRIYSNTGFDRLGQALEGATGLQAVTYLREAVLDPLGMSATELRGSVAYAGRSTTGDLSRFLAELLAPTLVDPGTLANAITEQFPGLAGVVPGLGRYDPNPWGLGFELKGSKAPHWTAPDGSPATFGHFGGSGTCLWVDPEAQVGCVILTNREFGDWAPPLWSELSSAVLARYGNQR